MLPRKPAYRLSVPRLSEVSLASLHSIQSKVFDFHAIDNARAPVLHDRSTRSFPDLLHGLQELLNLAKAVELQVDQYVVGFVPWPKNLVTANARTLPINRILVERLLSLLEIRHCVMDMNAGAVARSVLKSRRLRWLPVGRRASDWRLGSQLRTGR